jgi:hypothetical protein
VGRLVPAEEQFSGVLTKYPWERPLTPGFVVTGIFLRNKGLTPQGFVQRAARMVRLVGVLPQGRLEFEQDRREKLVREKG